MWKPFHFWIFLAVKAVICETYILTNSIFRLAEMIFCLVETGFFYSELCSSFWNRRWQLFSEKLYSCPWKLIFLLVEVHFFHILDTPASESYFFAYWKRIFKRIFHSVGWRRIFSLVETVYFYLIFFYKFKPSLKVSGNPFLGKTLLPIVERNFLYSGNHFLLFLTFFLQVETVTETS